MKAVNAKANANVVNFFIAMFFLFLTHLPGGVKPRTKEIYCL